MGRRIPLEERFARFTELDPETGCLIWLGKIDWGGYGHIKHNGRDRKAATVAYEMVHGPVPVWLVLDHLCRNRACVNPAHLEAVTQKENWDRGSGPEAIKRRKVLNCKICGKPKVYMHAWSRPEWVCPDVNRKVHKNGAK